MSQLVTAPVKKIIEVKVDQAAAFRTFTERIGDWWPVSTHSIEPEETVAIEMGCHLGGSIMERHRDGSTATWGEVLAWDPPHRVVFSWNPSYEERPSTEVEVQFVAIAASETRVELQHRGWERLGDAGTSMRADYESGWVVVLQLYDDAATP